MQINSQKVQCSYSVHFILDWFLSSHFRLSACYWLQCIGNISVVISEVAP